MRRAIVALTLALSACNAPEGVRFAAPERLAPADLPAFFDCLRENDATMVSAHRGGPRPGFPENAISTFQNTLAYAPVFLEVDVAQTSDDELVLMHDDTVDRTTDGEGRVAAMTLEQFQALNLRSEGGEIHNEHPPTLREALQWANGRAILELDVKRGVSYEDVVREVRFARALDRVAFITYSASGAARIARIEPEAMIYTTLRNIGELDDLERRGADLSRIVAWLGTDGVNTTLLEALNARGVEGRFGQFDGLPNYVGLALNGVESVATNDPVGAVRGFDAADDAEGYEALRCAQADESAAPPS